ncbi:hypothetical protein G7Z17_g12288 [Cylindrodendrum hubeiense]|uniref:Uncharacterized protein n=1 Tax=Cylindrodendrum hubeiense TaxID=595255 RepID=A0A9P5GZC5_9HYPO|nr:hypothetical protein G7Z17_g12288 [Cylindrodendrum hubeiense]
MRFFFEFSIPNDSNDPNDPKKYNKYNQPREINYSHRQRFGFELRRRSAAPASRWIRKWRARSAKSGSESDNRDISYASPTTSISRSHSGLKAFEQPLEQSFSPAAPWFKDESGTSKLKRKLFGKAPWHRKESGDSFSSIASSVREVLRGDTPPSTPILDSSYPFGGGYGNTQFPGGEAVRVKTPPIGEYAADGRPRGFFTPMTPPDIDVAELASSSRGSSRHIGHRRIPVPQSREWWEHIPQKPIRQDMYNHTAAFEFQIPEHLSSSPMCPTNIKHSTGGTGLWLRSG